MQREEKEHQLFPFATYHIAYRIISNLNNKKLNLRKSKNGKFAAKGIEAPFLKANVGKSLPKIERVSYGFGNKGIKNGSRKNTCQYLMSI